MPTRTPGVNADQSKPVSGRHLLGNQVSMVSAHEVSLPSSTPGVELAGVIAAPRDAPSRGLVVLLSGSGPQDRDQTVAGQPTFRVLRDALARAGFAAASWDDRGVGGSGGDYLLSSSDELVEDVISCARSLAERVDEGLPTFLLGHSQGALIAALVAVRGPSHFAGLALLAGAGRPGREVLLDQHRRICEAEGWSEGDIETSLAFKEACFDELCRYPDSIPADRREALRRSLDRIVEDHLGGGFDREPVLDDLLEWEWRFLLRTDPAAVLSRVSLPTCLAIGTADTQVDPSADLSGALEALETAAPSVATLNAEGLNHLFQVAPVGRPSAYQSLGAPFAEPLVSQLVDWLSGQARRAAT